MAVWKSIEVAAEICIDDLSMASVDQLVDASYCVQRAAVSPIGVLFWLQIGLEFTLHYGLHVSPSRLKATLYIRGSGSFVTSAAAPIATGWSEPVPGRDFQPAVRHLLYTAHRQD